MRVGRYTSTVSIGIPIEYVFLDVDQGYGSTFDCRSLWCMYDPLKFQTENSFTCFTSIRPHLLTKTKTEICYPPNLIWESSSYRTHLTVSYRIMAPNFPHKLTCTGFQTYIAGNLSYLMHFVMVESVKLNYVVCFGRYKTRGKICVFFFRLTLACI